MFKLKVNNLLIGLAVLCAVVAIFSSMFLTEMKKIPFSGTVIAKLQEDHKSSTDYKLVVSNDSSRKSFNVKPEDYVAYEKGDHAELVYTERVDNPFAVKFFLGGFICLILLLFISFFVGDDLVLIWD